MECQSVVLVRVRGIDTQGWKTSHANFFAAENGVTSLSSSGVILPPQVCVYLSKLRKVPNSCYVLCTANHIAPFLDEPGLPLSEPKLQEGTCVDVLAEVTAPPTAENYEVSYTEQGASAWLGCRVIRIGVIDSVEDAISSLTMGSSGWVVGPRVPRTHPLSSPSRISAGLVALLELPSLQAPVASVLQRGLPWLSPRALPRGTEVRVAASPFGLLSPAIFHNSLSRGVISNFLGSRLFHPPATTTPTNSSTNSSFSWPLFAFSASSSSSSCSSSSSSSPSSSSSSSSSPFASSSSSVSGSSSPNVTSYRAVLMTDARCPPGSEGGAVLAGGCVVGMLLLPLRHTSSVQLNLFVSVDALYLWLCQQPLDPRTATIHSMLPPPLPELKMEQEQQHVMSTVDRSLVIARVGSSWASAVILSAEGHILTNAHLLRPHLDIPAAENKPPPSTKLPDFFTTDIDDAPSDTLNVDPFNVKFKYNDTVMVRLQQHHCCSPNTANTSSSYSAEEGSRWVRCQVLYFSTGPWDVCLLKANVDAPLIPAKLSRAKPERGQPVFVVGHALFGPPANLLATVSRGVLSRVAFLPLAGSPVPVLLQTDAAVHSGNSGGFLADDKGSLLGLVTSNVKHTWQPLLLSEASPSSSSSSVTQHPLLNFSIPASQLEPVFRFCESGDRALLSEFNRPNEAVAKLWRLEENNPRPAPVLRTSDKYKEVLQRVSEQQSKL